MGLYSTPRKKKVFRCDRRFGSRRCNGLYQRIEARRDQELYGRPATLFQCTKCGRILAEIPKTHKLAQDRPMNRGKRC
jgi:ribosomal protein S27E